MIVVCCVSVEQLSIYAEFAAKNRKNEMDEQTLERHI